MPPFSTLLKPVKHHSHFAFRASAVWLGNSWMIRSSAARVTALRREVRSICAAILGETQ